MAKTPNTISDKDWDSIRRRAEKAAPPLFSREAVRRRVNSAAQQRKAGQS